MPAKIPFNAEHLSCCLLVRLALQFYQSRQILSVPNCLLQMSSIKHLMQPHRQGQGSPSESCVLRSICWSRLWSSISGQRPLGLFPPLTLKTRFLHLCSLVRLTLGLFQPRKCLILQWNMNRLKFDLFAKRSKLSFAFGNRKTRSLFKVSSNKSRRVWGGFW